MCMKFTVVDVWQFVVTTESIRLSHCLSLYMAAWTCWDWGSNAKLPLVRVRSGCVLTFFIKYITLVWSQSKLSISTKLRIYSTCMLPVLLYGSETSWTLIQADWKKLDSFHLRCQRRILHISWDDFVSNDEVLQRTGLFWRLIHRP